MLERILLVENNVLKKVEHFDVLSVIALEIEDLRHRYFHIQPRELPTCLDIRDENKEI
ncbi:MAG: hypothetical protein ACI9K1_002769 [Arcticibacterium sp.]